MKARKLKKTKTQTKVIAVSSALVTVGVIGTATAFGTGTEEPRRIEAHGSQLSVPVDGGRATVDLTSLAVRARADDGRTWQLSAPAAGDLGAPGRVSIHEGKASWRYGDRGLTVTASAQDGRLAVTVRSARQSSLTWPVSGTDRTTEELQVPRGEGLSIPVADRWWNSASAGLAGNGADMAEGLTMPFWGTSQSGQHGASYIVESDIGTTLK
ncbi:glycoside hydrolase, partial [Streptomyces sp. NPDC002586]